jgi:hypothetical protein
VDVDVRRERIHVPGRASGPAHEQERRINTHIDWSQISKIEVLGMDEIALKKGHRDFVAIVSGYSEGQLLILGVLKDREKSTVKAFLQSMPARLRQQVDVICSDLYEGFINAAKEVFPNQVKITADRFHVSKLYRKKVDDLRAKEMKRLKERVPEESYQARHASRGCWLIPWWCGVKTTATSPLPGYSKGRFAGCAPEGPALKCRLKRLSIIQTLPVQRQAHRHRLPAG